jgi:nicotinamide-nucleotide amidase
MKLALLLTGDEIMSGDIVDSNSSMIAQALQMHGWRIQCKSTIGDNLSLIISEIKRLTVEHDVLIINGGLGPTVDDLTAQALADAANIPLQEHPQALEHLRAWCERLHIPLNAANYKQAVLPMNCDIIANPVGSAVGFSLMLNNCLVICTPGVPRELRGMLDDTIIHNLTQRFASESVDTIRLVAFGLGESTLQELIDEQLPNWPAEIVLGFRASIPTVEIKLTIRDQQYFQLRNEWKEKIIQLLGEFYLGENGCSLAEAALNACRANTKTLITAESCTGGMIASQITQVAGASDVFLGGFISYANAMKQAMLDIPHDVIEKHGAVSEAVVTAMATQALTKSGADIVIAVTGIAGPSGASPDKPVGSVWICWGDNTHLYTDYLLLQGNRPQFQQGLTAVALDLIRRCAHGLNNQPNYLERRRHPTRQGDHAV